MPPELEQLLVLQDKDQHIRKLKLDLRRMPADKERALNKLAGETEAVRAAKEAVQLNEVAMKNLELQIKTRQDTITKLKVQQYETRKNEEFKALGHETERYGKEVTKLEDDELVLMEKAELLKAEHAAKGRTLAATQAVVDEELALIASRQTHVMAQLAEFEGIRAGLAGKVDEDLLATYDRIFQNRGDSAVAELNGQVCRGCNMKVTPATVQAAKVDKTLVSCPNCGRFVYYAELP